MSVVVPCYNYGQYLPECLSSLLSQRGVDVDVLIIDDASTDGSGEVAAALIERLPNVRLIRHVTNVGHIGTYNEGLEQVEGDYVVLLSADDLLTPGALARATALMEAHPEVGLVYGNPLVFDGELPRPRESVRSWSIWSGRQWIRAQYRRGLSIIFSPEAVVRSTVQREVGGYRASLPYTADLDMWLRVASKAYVGRVNGCDQAFRRDHAASMMHRNHGTVLKDLEVRMAAYESFLGCEMHQGVEASRLRHLARKTAAAESLDLACSLLDDATDSVSVQTQEDIRAYVDFARGTTEDYQRLLGWREYSARSGDAADFAAPARARLLAEIRGLKARAKWQRWYRVGI